MSDDDLSHRMVRDLGIAPALDIDDNQRFEQLREWHEEDAEKDEAKNKSRPRGASELRP